MTRNDEFFPFRLAAKFYDLVNSSALLAYKSIIQAPPEISREEVLKTINCFLEDWFIFGYGGGGSEEISLEQKLATQGEHYISPERIMDMPKSALWQAALQYDLKGIVPQSEENLEDFVYRANTTLRVHRELHQENYAGLDIDIDKKTFEVKLKRDFSFFRIPKKDLEEANKRIPYYMDLSWVTAYTKKEGDLIIPALGVTFTLPQYNGLSFIQMRDRYKSRAFYLEVLSHEMVHVGTVYLDNPKRREFLETKAYAVGRGSFMGEYAVAVNSKPNLLLRIAQYVIQYYIPWVPDRAFKYAPKVKDTVRIATTTGMFNQVKKELVALYGNKGNYILGRLTADEMDEFRYTNDIPGRIAMKDNLKWQIMGENFTSLK